MKFLKNFILLGVILLISGCTQAPHPIGGGLYMTTSTGAGFSAEGVTKSVYAEAEKLAKEKNKVVYVESIDVEQGALGRNPPSAKLMFRLVEPNSEEAKSKQRLIPGLQRIQMIGNNNNPPKSEPTLEEKLSKIKKLYEDGTITKEEYDKARIGILSNY